MRAAAAGRTVASVIQRQVRLWFLFLLQRIVMTTRDEKMSRWCIDQVICFRTWTELDLCAAWAREVQLVITGVNDALAAPDGKKT